MQIFHLLLPVGALAIVIGLVLLLSKGARRWLPAMQGSADRALLVVRSSLAIDPRRRLHLVSIQGREAILLTGPHGDVLLPWPATDRAPP